MLITARRVGLEANEEKTENLVMISEKDRQRRDDEHLKVGNLRFKNVIELRYVGFYVASDNDTNFEVVARIQKGNRCLFTLGHLRSRVLSRRGKNSAFIMP